MRYAIAFVLLTAALSLGSFSASATPSCTTWTTQADGSQWRTCVGDDGRQYCEESVNGKVYRVSCKTHS